MRKIIIVHLWENNIKTCPTHDFSIDLSGFTTLNSHFFTYFA